MVEDHFGRQLQVQFAHAMDDETAFLYSWAFIPIYSWSFYLLSFAILAIFTEYLDLHLGSAVLGWLYDLLLFYLVIFFYDGGSKSLNWSLICFTV